MRERNVYYSKKLLKQILEGTPKIAGFICLSLFELGAITVSTFLSPTYKFEEPIALFLGDWKNKPVKLKKETIRKNQKRSRRTAPFTEDSF